MSIVGTQRIPGTRCLVWVTRASRALTGSLRTDSGAGRVRLRPAVAGEALAAAHLETAPRALERAVAPFHRRRAARAGLDSGLGSRFRGRRSGHPSTVRDAPDGCRGVWVPRTPSGHPPARAGRTPGGPALRSPVPTLGSRATPASVPGVDTREPRRSRVSPFSYRSRRRRADPREGWCCWCGRRLPHQDWTPTHLGTGRCSAPVFRNVPRWLCRPMICVHLSDLTEKALLVPSKRGSTR